MAPFLFFRYIKRPFVEKPLIEKKWNDPPKIPYQWFTVWETVGKLSHMVVTKAPMSKVCKIEEPVINTTQH